MAITCEHVHRLELRKSFKFWAAVASVIPVFLILNRYMSDIKFRPYFSLLTDKGVVQQLRT